MKGTIGDTLVIAHEAVESSITYNYIEFGIACLLAGIGIGCMIFSIIYYFRETNKFVFTKKVKRKKLTKYNFHLLKRTGKYKVTFSKPSKQHSDFVVRE